MQYIQQIERMLTKGWLKMMLKLKMAFIIMQLKCSTPPLKPTSKQGDGQSMEQRQQETMKLPLYSETKGRKKISAAKKSDKRSQIKAPPAGRVVVLDENGVPLGHRKCSVCN